MKKMTTSVVAEMERLQEQVLVVEMEKLNDAEQVVVAENYKE
ncbi:hypothetical protein C5167_031179 [Papaver somniferum]|nr:hypothetical protein C5167_031179 [Papaver somniferum]